MPFSTGPRFRALAVLFVLAFNRAALAGDENPQGCDGTATGIAIEALADGSPTLAPVIEGQVIFFRVTVFQPLPNGCNYFGGQLSVTHPDGTTVPLAGFGGDTPDIPTVTFLAPFEVVSPVPYIVTEADATNGTLTARADFGATVPQPMQANGTFQTDPQQATASATTSLPLPLGAINVEKDPSATMVCTGDLVTYTYTVTTGPGLGALSPVMLMDDHCADVEFVGGDDNGNGVLEATETWTYECSSSLFVDTTNTVTAMGTLVATGVGVTDTAEATVTVAPVPTALITGPVTACPGQSSLMYMAVENSMPPLPGATFEWTIEGDATFCDMGPESMGPMICVNADAACNGSFRLTVVVTAGDCTNESTYDVIVRDLEPPRIACPSNRTFSCDAVGDFGTATTSDTCDTAPLLTVSEVTTPGSCPQSEIIVRTWTSTDACGNTSSCTQMITIVDVAPPSCAAPADVTIGCDQPSDPAATGTASGVDACGPVTPTFADTITPGGCPQEMTISRAWTTTDACGNAATCIQTITIVDGAAPTCTPPADVTVACDGSTDPTATGEAGGVDNCGPVTIGFNDLVVPGRSPIDEVITRTWTVIDACGNLSSCAQTITTLRCPGACCLEDGSCVEVLETECADLDGTYNGDGSTCDDPSVMCALPEGACCATDGSCQVLTAEACALAGGDYQGDDTLCADVQCPCLDGLLVTWDLDACLSWDDAANYDEFIPVITGDCPATATILTREMGEHSCVADRFGQFSNPSALCFSVPNDADIYEPDSPLAARFTVTLPGPAQLRTLRFWQAAPVVLLQTDEDGLGVSELSNDPPNFFGVRVTRDGAEVYRVTGIAPTSEWTQQIHDFPAMGFEVAEGDSATFEVELLPYDDNYNGIGGDRNAWELDDIELEGTCCVEVGACCLPDRSCVELTLSECANLGGEHQGAGTRCADVVCPCVNLVEVTWNMDACYAQTGNSSAFDYSEFTPSIEGTCNTVQATTLDRDQGGHSCTNDRNSNPGRAMCIGTTHGLAGFVADHPEALRFSVTADGPTSLGALRFWQSAPTQFAFTSWSSPSEWVIGPNNPPQLYGVRVLRNGVEIFRMEDIPTSTDWSHDHFEFTGGGFIVANGETATFEFELLSYAHTGMTWYDGTLMTAWDLDDITVEICCEGTPTGACCFSDQSCVETDQWACVNTLGGLYVGDAVACADFDCPGPPAVMLVVVDETVLTAQEQIRRDLLEQWGMVVTPLTSTSPQSTYDLRATAADVAYVTEEIASGDVGTKVTNLPIGVVNEEQALVDELLFGTQGFETSIDWIEVMATAHPITDVFSGGTLQVTNVPQMLITMEYPLAAGAALLARSDYQGMVPSMIAIEAGAALYPSGVAAARRVQLPFGSTSFDCNQLNANGRTLLHRSLLWAGGFPLAAPLAGGSHTRTGADEETDLDGSSGEATGDSAACAGDVNGDGRIDESDVDALLFDWGPQPGGAHAADLDGNGAIDADDLVALVLNWGTCQ